MSMSNKEVIRVQKLIEERGWMFKSGNRHLKYESPKNPDGTVDTIILPSTPSGTRWLPNKIGELRRGGQQARRLAEFLADPATVRARERVVDQQEARSTATPAPTTPAGVGQALVAPKTVAPDGPLTDQIPVAPLTVDSTFGIPLGGGLRGRVVKITPDVARHWLAEFHGVNRRRTDDHIGRLKDAIEAGDWVLNAQTIAFDSNNRLYDGQHRLTAIAEGDVAVHALVVWGAQPRAAQETTDTGVTRTLAGMLRIRGFKYDINLATISMGAWKMQVPGEIRSHRDIRPQTIFAFLDENMHIYAGQAGLSWKPGFALPEPVQMRQFEKWSRALHMTPPRIIGPTWWLFTQRGGIAEADAFWAKVANGNPNAYEDAYDPCWMLRDVLLTDRAVTVRERKKPLRELLGLTIKAWNNVQTGHRPKQLLMKGGMNAEQFPVPLYVTGHDEELMSA